MGIGISKDGELVTYTVPLLGGEGDDKWKDNTWLTDHLRQLAKHIEESRMNIISIGTQTTNSSSPFPELVVRGYEHYIKAKTKSTPFSVRAVDFDLMNNRQKWEIWEEFLDVIWVCNRCRNDEPEFRTAVQGAGMGSIECPWCGNVLTHRTNGGQNNPFNWTFIEKKL